MDLPPEGESAKISTPQTATDPAWAAALFEQSVEIMARLRAPDGCPWDREQSFDTIRKYTLEETYEVFDAIERRAWPDLKDELGDLLFALVNLARRLEVDPEAALRGANAKFDRRFRRIEALLAAEGRTPTEASLDEMEAHWQQAKREERSV